MGLPDLQPRPPTSYNHVIRRATHNGCPVPIARWLEERKAQNAAKLRASRSKGKDNQGEIWASLPLDVPTWHTPTPSRGQVTGWPKDSAAAAKGWVGGMASRPLTPIPHNGSISHAATSSDNYVPGSEIPQYTAIRFCEAVTTEEADEHLSRAEEIKKV
ncbi:hypothetical protein NX059_012308 [Plenodomus lindquistii]|nr:hypothetical protein NX059_012308 [Plenodomus lindquistii]